MDNQKKKKFLIIAAIVGAVVILFFYLRGRMTIMVPRKDGATGTPGLTMGFPALGYTTYNIPPYQPSTGGVMSFPTIGGAASPCPCPKVCDYDATYYSDNTALLGANSGTLLNWYYSLTVGP
jgi:hypothetical protein